MKQHTFKTYLLALFLWVLPLLVLADGKKPLDFSVYDGWKSLSEYVLSDDGRWVSYEINPQDGDGFIYLYDVQNETLDSIARGKTASFSADGNFWAFQIKAQKDTVRQLELKKVKKDKFPKDTLYVRNLSNGAVKTYADIKKYSVSKEGGDWLAILMDKELKKKEAKKDTAEANIEAEERAEKKEEETKKDKKKKSFQSKGTPLVFYRPSTGDSLCLEKVTHYDVADNGKRAYVVQSIGDTTEVSVVLKFDAAKWQVDTLFKSMGKIEKLNTAYSGDQCAYLFSPDTAKTKVYRLYHYADKLKTPRMIVDTLHADLPSAWSVLTKGSLFFSKSGDKLFFGAGNRPQEAPKDTLTKDEKVHVDVWHWKEAEIQPMQKKRLGKVKDRAYLCTYILKENKLVQLESPELPRVSIQEKGDLNVALGYDESPYKITASWTSKWASDIYLVDVTTGTKKLLKKEQYRTSELSPDGKWFVYYEPADSNYYAKNVQTDVKALLSKGIEVPLADELHDTPNEPYAYGILDFTTDMKSVIVYDRYDIWKLDLAGKKTPVCLTNEEGRKHTTEFRYVRLDKDEKAINLKEGVLLRAFNTQTKQSGLYKLDRNGLSQIMMGDFNVYNPLKAKSADLFVWKKSTFKEYPELQVTDHTFSSSKVISNTNPQQKDYKWGNIQLVDWVASDGLDHQGLLVTPENMDPNKKYPMVIYFYERCSDRMHRYYSPRPSRSTINWTMYTSNDYVVFVPDIYYREGDPGLCAYEAIVSGALSMVDQFKFVDRENMAIQGQSWGGYQVAHLVTRTNLFKAGMAGAPVSNMTSAYGGIRWGTGMSRMFQYENTQSRIGGTLWERTNKYIENSPVFFAPQVETPLLIMHNDNDGSVPWYQGIEYFMALRRLNKPVWMLVYNNEEHNLTRRANSKDLSIRMMQFFDHYLKGKPMPVWMKEGIPATKKGKEMGYDLTE
ncbi:MAG: S9 family peptidase [Marinilabiliaceae bacterium]|nr:S9 family peptidase [Marinilabiliaceae bacterium]